MASPPELDSRLAAKIRDRYPQLPESLVDAAARGMLTMGEEHRGLPLVAEHLEDDEPVHAAAACQFKLEGVEARGVVVVLDDRVVAAGRSPTTFGTNTATVLDMADITDVSVAKKVLWAQLTLARGGDELVLKRAPKAAATWVAAAVRERQAATGA